MFEAIFSSKDDGIVVLGIYARKPAATNVVARHAAVNNAGSPDARNV